MDPNLQAVQKTIDDLNAQIIALKNRPTFSLKDVAKKYIPGWNGKVGAHMMCWFGDGNTRRVNRYKSNDPATIIKQLNAMQAVGLEFVIPTWKGTGNFVDDAVNKVMAEVEARQMQFAYLLDPWIAKVKPVDQRTAEVINQLTSKLTVLNADFYMKSDGKPLVLEFSLGAVGVDVGKVQQALPMLNILSWHTGYSWPNITPDGKGSLATLAADHAKSTMKIASANLGFKDAGYPLPDGTRDFCHEVWDRSKPARAIDHQAGNWFFDQLVTIKPWTPYIAIPTWNDHDEETGFEQFVSMLTGIRIGV